MLVDDEDGKLKKIFYSTTNTFAAKRFVLQISVIFSFKLMALREKNSTQEMRNVAPPVQFVHSCFNSVSKQQHTRHLHLHLPNLTDPLIEPLAELK